MRRRGQSTALAILLYHRIGEDDGPDPMGLNVSPERFAEQLHALARRFELVTLSERDGTIRDGPAVVITFDDGYAGVLHHAKPLLQRLSAPASAFIASGFVGSGREFWWEELAGLILSSPRPLTELRLDGELIRARDDGLPPWRRRGVTSTYRLYYLLARKLARVTIEQRERLLEAVAAQVGAEATPRRGRMPLDERGVCELASGGLIEIGAHTVSHPVLATLDASDQSLEITGCKHALEALTTAKVSSFAYPYGGASDYTPESVSLVRTAGFERACANHQGPARPTSDPFQLPRMIVRDWDGAGLVARVERLLR